MHAYTNRHLLFCYSINMKAIIQRAFVLFGIENEINFTIIIVTAFLD